MEKITLHCSATNDDLNITCDQIREWHIAKGWSDIGYHFVIHLNGEIKIGRPISRTGAHVKHHNKNNIGICYIGGLHKNTPANTMTRAQEESMYELVTGLQTKYQISDADVYGHRDFPNVAKECPCFDVKSWLKRMHDERGRDLGGYLV